MSLLLCGNISVISCLSFFWERKLKNLTGENHSQILNLYNLYNLYYSQLPQHDRMVVGFTTTYAISAYHHQICEFEPRS